MPQKLTKLLLAIRFMLVLLSVAGGLAQITGAVGMWPALEYSITIRTCTFGASQEDAGLVLFRDCGFILHRLAMIPPHSYWGFGYVMDRGMIRLLVPNWFTLIALCSALFYLGVLIGRMRTLRRQVGFSVEVQRM
jgi:hypothetical protein